MWYSGLTGDLLQSCCYTLLPCLEEGIPSFLPISFLPMLLWQFMCRWLYHGYFPACHCWFIKVTCTELCSNAVQMSPLPRRLSTPHPFAIYSFICSLNFFQMLLGEWQRYCISLDWEYHAKKHFFEWYFSVSNFFDLSVNKILLFIMVYIEFVQ